MRREFSQRTKLSEWEAAGGKCRKCGHKIKVGERRVFDHACPDGLGGSNEGENCQLLCSSCNKAKTASDVSQIRKADRQKAAFVGAKTRKGRPMPGTVASGLKKKFDGTVERRT